MLTLTFAEQVKLVLSRKKITIKQLAEMIELQTGIKTSRQNLTQKLGRDNFQEQDMRMIAKILGCNFQLNILEEGVIEVEPVEAVKSVKEVDEVKQINQVIKVKEKNTVKVEDKVEDKVEVKVEDKVEVKVEDKVEVEDEVEVEDTVKVEEGVTIPNIIVANQPISQLLVKDVVEDSADNPNNIVGKVNPYTGYEYVDNSVRVHPKRIGYVQVYSRATHQWSEMTEWAFLGYQDQQRRRLGKAYKEPTYLD